MEHSKIKVYFQSTVRGITEREENLKDVVYVGRLVRIPNSDFPTEDPLKYESDIMELFQDIEMDGYVYEYIPDGVAERIEIRERSTGDCLALWRIPFRIKSKGVLL